MRRSFHALVIAVIVTLSVALPLLAEFPGTDVMLPVVARIQGSGNPPPQFYSTIWFSDLSTTNSASIQLEFYQRDSSANPTASASLTLSPGETRRIDDALTTLFQLQNVAGSLRVTSTEDVLVSTRNYDLPSGGTEKDTTGQYFGAIPTEFAIGSGEVTQLQGVEQTTEGRYNFGAVEITGQSVTLHATLLNPNGSTIGSKDYPLAAHGQMQKSVTDITQAINGVPNALLQISVTSGTGKILAYGTHNTNTSQDGTGFEMAFKQSLLSGSGGLSAVNHDASLRGDGTGGNPLGIANGGVSDVNVASGIAYSKLAGVPASLPPSGLAGGSLSGSYPNPGIAAGVVGATQLANGAVGKPKMAATGGTAGQVLGTDGTNLVWQSAGLALPYTGTAAASGTAFSVSNSQGPAVLGISNGAAGIAVRGDATSGVGVNGNSVSNAGVYGTSSSSNGASGSSSGANGVYGITTASGAGLAGVHGEGAGLGVYGKGASGTGVWGDGGTGIQGVGSALYGVTGTGPSAGVYGTSAGGPGVEGIAAAAGQPGVFGQSGTGSGVQGSSSGGSGVDGVTSAAGQAGVYGHSSAGSGVHGDSGSNVGVYGTSASSNGVSGVSTSGNGVYGTTSAAGQAGVIGQASAGVGVHGDSGSNAGVYGTSASSNGVSGVSGSANGVYGSTSSIPGNGNVAGVNGSGWIGVKGQSGNYVGVWGDAALTGVMGTCSGPGCFAINCQGDGQYTGSWNHFSDARFKRDVATLADALAKVLQLRGVSFTWRRDEFPAKRFDAGPQVGFIAQEVEPVYPELVTTDREGYKSIDYTKLAPILTEAIKEQQATIEAQQMTIEGQRAELDQVKETVAQLQTLVAEMAARLSNHTTAPRR